MEAIIGLMWFVFTALIAFSMVAVMDESSSQRMDDT